MNKKIKTTAKAAPHDEPQRKVGAKEGRKRLKASSYACNDHDGDQAKENGGRSHHAQNYGAKLAITEGAARIGMQIAAMNRAVGAGARVEHQAILITLDRLVTAPGETPQDALAFITVAKTLLAIPLSEATPLDEGDESLALFYVSDLIQRAIQTLEAVSGQSSGAYNGNSLTVN